MKRDNFAISADAAMSAFDAAKPLLEAAKIVATPTPASWSQAYSAGNFFAVVALCKKEKGEESEQDLLSALGKEIINSLEEEYFTLEVKDLTSIKGALKTVQSKIPENVSAAFVISSLSKENILYVFVLGAGKVVLKRGEKIGTILQALDDGELVSASGFVEDNDVVILETKKFSEIISNDKILSSLDNLPPAEIVESFAPLVCEKGEGEATGIIVRYKNIVKNKAEELDQKFVEPDEEINQKVNFFPKFPILPFSLKLPKFEQNVSLRVSKLNHRKKIFLTIAVVIFATLLISVVSNIRKQQNDKVQAVFAQAKEKAQKKYEEGQSLAVLNKSLAKDDFLSAAKILNESKDKLPANSNEQKQVVEFLKKVESAISDLSGAALVNPVLADGDENSLLSYAVKSKFRILTYDEKYIYGVDDNAVTRVEKGGGSEKKILKNENDWQSAVGLGTYFENIYILDKKGQIAKFVKGDDGYTKTNYLAKDVSLDFSNAVSMAIDNSVWVLLKDNIAKFTRGNQEGFTVSGLDTPFKNPTRILTSLDLDNLYILDNGNKRIVVLGKDGSYKASYQAKIMEKASGFDVLEKDKAIYVLSSGKIYKINIK